MADVTISSLSRGIPFGNNILPYSTGSDTLGVPVSAIFQNGCVVGIGTTTTTIPNEGYPVKSSLEIYNNVTAGIKLATQKGYAFIRYADNNETSNLIIDADRGSTSSGDTELLLNVRQINVIKMRTNKVWITQPVEVSADVAATNTAKAYAIFDGSNAINTPCTILKSYNIASIRKENYIGKYKVTFTNSITWPYVPVVGAFNNNTGDGGWNAVSYDTLPTLSNFNINCFTSSGGNYMSQKYVSFVVF